MPIEIGYLDNGTGVLHVGRGLLSAKDILDAKSATFASDDSMDQGEDQRQAWQ